MSGRAIEKLLAAEDLAALPDDGLIHELVEGWVLSEPLPQGRHGRLVTRIAVLLEGFVRPRGLGTVYTGDTGFILAHSPDTVRGPDIAFVSSGRREILEDEDRFLPGPPDLAVEVLSPGDRAGRIREKVADYLTAGTRMVWVVDPARERVIVYRALLSPRTLQPGDEVEGEDVLPGFRAEVSEFL